MNQIINKIHSSKLLTLVSTIILFLFILITSRFLAKPARLAIENYFELSFYAENVFFKLIMLILSIGVILFINNGSLKGYGFNKPKRINYIKLVLLTMGFTYGAMIIGNIVFIKILGGLFPIESGAKSFPIPNSIIEMILTVWIWSSICEEIFVRGLLQGFMKNLRDRKVWILSYSVIISGLLFGLMHLGLLIAGMNPWFVGFIVFFTTNIGLLTAYYREKSDSLFPPILIHFLANLFGSLPLVIMMLLNIQIPTG